MTDYQSFKLILYRVFFFIIILHMSTFIITGSDLKEIIRDKNIRNKDLVNITGKSVTEISRYLRNKTKMPYDFLLQIANYAHLQIDDLIKSDPIPYDVFLEPTTTVAAEPDPSADYDRLDTTLQKAKDVIKLSMNQSETYM